ncbi:hypothetical protein FTO70_01455 [Methanosarcina sp. KYL-1]|uniref:hypothetical protein n=1 Tax=Methanosarcina sp. KYL-1 TaxID=2602068 RepID=UPI0021008D6D|nr:hypothetical protein [Methanosarcina sp. KYL-1]MCQ1534383.1 hypothetical protein [Methanosarcina sp. KYL-1]
MHQKSRIRASIPVIGFQSALLNLSLKKLGVRNVSSGKNPDLIFYFISQNHIPQDELSISAGFPDHGESCQISEARGRNQAKSGYAQASGYNRDGKT